jgi:transcriptional regulator with XRE-family HTH domain
LNFGLVNEEVLDVTLRDIGNKLTELRRRKGYTSHESFAYDHDIPRMHYWRIENGKTNLTIRSLMRILNIHKISLQEFFLMFDREK